MLMPMLLFGPDVSEHDVHEHNANANANDNLVVRIFGPAIRYQAPGWLIEWLIEDDDRLMMVDDWLMSWSIDWLGDR